MSGSLQSSWCNPPVPTNCFGEHIQGSFISQPDFLLKPQNAVPGLGSQRSPQPAGWIRTPGCRDRVPGSGRGSFPLVLRAGAGKSAGTGVGCREGPGCGMKGIKSHRMLLPQPGAHGARLPQNTSPPSLPPFPLPGLSGIFGNTPCLPVFPFPE